MKKGIIAALIGASLLCTAVTGCSSSGGDGADTPGGNSQGEAALKIWVDPGAGDYYRELLASYNEDTGSDVEIEVVESDTAKAQEYLKKDPETAADVFSVPHDQLGQMVEAGVVCENTKYVDEITANNTEQSVQAATYEGKVYGYPYGIEGLMVYYDKTKLTEEDVKTFEGLTSKGKIGINLTESGNDYFAVPFFIANGCELYGPDGEDPEGTTFNTDKGVHVLEWIRNLKDNPNVVQANDDMLSKLESGEIVAMVSGPWGEANVKEILGDNMGVAVYPTVDFGDGTVQMKAFLGVKLFAVNAATKHPLEAMALANYLGTKECQEKDFEEMGTIPCNIEAQKSEAVQSDPMASTVVKLSSDEYSVITPKIPEMVTFWPAAAAVISDAYNGNIPEDQMMDKLDQLVKDTSGTE